LHSQQVCHREIKPENLFLDSEFNLKLADFGAATTTEGTLEEIIGTQAYMAPEIWLRKPYSGS
jgi:BR serine/threonine kinase